MTEAVLENPKHLALIVIFVKCKPRELAER